MWSMERLIEEIHHLPASYIESAEWKLPGFSLNVILSEYQIEVKPNNLTYTNTRSTSQINYYLPTQVKTKCLSW